MASVDREDRRKSLFEKQAMMDKAQKAKAKEEKKQASLLSPRRKVRILRSPVRCALLGVPPLAKQNLACIFRLNGFCAAKRRA